jgi:hypothetical protein
MIRLSKLNGVSITITLAAISILILTGCSAPAASPAASALPDYVMHADHEVREAYQHAVDHPDHFETVPCYCGCHRIGHRSELDCFISDRAADGTITFDNHASVCGVCVDIAQDVITMRAEGKSALEVRQTIDATYSQIGTGTDTVYPGE